MKVGDGKGEMKKTPADMERKKKLIIEKLKEKIRDKYFVDFI